MGYIHWKEEKKWEEGGRRRERIFTGWLTMFRGSTDCRDATLITSGSIKKKRIKEKNEVGPRVGCS